MRHEGAEARRPSLPRRRSLSRKIGEPLLVVLAFTVLTGLFTRPTAPLDNHVAPDLGDPVFNLWVLAWDFHQLREGLPAPWEAPIYQPQAHALLLSDHLLGTAVLTWPLERLTGSVPLVYNLLFLLSFPICGWTAYTVIRAAGTSAPAAFAGAAAFAFSPFRWSHASHLQILLAAWIPLVLWLWHRLLTRPGWKRAAAFLGAYALHMAGGAYLAYMIHVPLAVLLVNQALPRGADGRRGFRRWLAAGARGPLAGAVVGAAVLAVASLGPYVVRRPLDLERDAREMRRFGATSVSLLTPSVANPHLAVLEAPLAAIAPAHPPKGWLEEKSLFPGILPTLLFLVGILGLGRQLRRRPARPLPVRRRLVLATLGALALASFVAADLYTFRFELEPGHPAWLDPSRLYPLLAAVLLGAAAGWWALRRLWGGNHPWDLAGAPVWQRGVLLSGAASLLLAFPVFFVPAAAVVPGLGGMRAPSRFMAVASFCLAVFVAAGLDRLLRARLPERFSRTRLRFAVGLVAAGVLTAELAPLPLAWKRIPTPAEFPAVHRWIAGRRDIRLYLELPRGRPATEIPYLWFQTLHWTPMVNGYSGHAPPHYLALRRICCWPAPDEDALSLLRHLGVSHVVIHGGKIRRRWIEEQLFDWRRRVRAGEVTGVEEIYADEAGDLVYRIDPGPDLTAPRRPP